MTTTTINHLAGVKLFLSQNALFANLTSTEMDELVETAHRNSVSKYHFVYANGEASKQLFLLMSGSVKIVSHSDFGREVIKTVVQPGGVFGELCLTGEPSRSDSASTLKMESSYLSLPFEKVQELMQRNFKFCRSVLEFIGNRLRNAEKQLENLIIKDARTRIVDFLRDSAHETGRPIGLEMLVKHPFTHQDMAAITGTSRQMVTAVMNELKRSNQIYFNRHSFLVRDVAKLA
jgi:CRP/FNR family transcriptional regulator, cyclic AMP receptor protein